MAEENGEKETAKFRIREGYNKHAVRGEGVYYAGDQVDLDHYDPRWADKFEALDDQGKKLKGAALALTRIVRLDKLDDAVEQAGGEEAVMAQVQLQEEVGQQLTPASAMEGRGVGDHPRTPGAGGTPVSAGGSTLSSGGSTVPKGAGTDQEQKSETSRTAKKE